MKEINRHTVAGTGRQMYFMEPFFSLSGYDLVKMNRALSDQLSSVAEVTAEPVAGTMRVADINDDDEGLEPPTGDGLRVTLLQDDDEQLFLALSSDESGFWAGRDDYSNLSVGSKFLGRWLRQHYKLKKNLTYRFGVAAQSVEKEGRRMWKIATPKLYKGANK